MNYKKIIQNKIMLSIILITILLGAPYAAYYFSLDRKVEREEPEAMIEKALEILHSKDEGEDKFLAYILLYKAASRKHPAAQYWIGRMYYEGKIIEENYYSYRYYMGLSAGQNYLPARLFLDTH